MRPLRIPALLLALVLTGCGQATPPAGGAPAPAADLVGTWTVSGPASVAPGTTVAFEPGTFELRSGPDVRTGSWRSAPGVFVAAVDGASGPAPDVTGPGWLATATRADADGTGAVLRDRAGAVTARLDPVARTPAPATPEPAPLPAGLTPAGGPRLIGSWVPAGRGSPTRAGLTFAADGGYSGSDGCNGAEGRWATGDGGLIVATSGPTTLMACDGMMAVPSWLGGAARAGFDGDVLVLLDATGAELGRLRPAAAG